MSSSGFRMQTWHKRNFSRVIETATVFLFIMVMNPVYVRGELSPRDKVELAELELKGTELSDADARNLEGKLAEHPEDLAVRTELLSYYALKEEQLNSVLPAHQEHVLWMITHHPDALHAGSAFMGLDPRRDGARYEEAKSLWLEQVKTHPGNTAVLRNAASFLLVHDRVLAEDLLKQAKQLEPNNPEWSERLGHLYGLSPSKKSTSSKQEAAAKSLLELERTLRGADEIKKYDLLPDLAKAAFDAGELDKAKRYATELSRVASSNWNYGNAVHHGNIVLGRLALQAGDIKEAKAFLVKAGKTPGSPQLDSFGPNMTLAKELLERGERQTVLEYFQLCGTFWKMDDGQLGRWAATVQAGSIPDFGSNLDY